MRPFAVLEFVIKQSCWVGIALPTHNTLPFLSKSLDDYAGMGFIVFEAT